MIMTCSTTSVLYFTCVVLHGQYKCGLSVNKISDHWTCIFKRSDLVLFFNIILIFTHQRVTKNPSSLLCSFLCFFLKHKPHHKSTAIPAHGAVADGWQSCVQDPEGRAGYSRTDYWELAHSRIVSSLSFTCCNLNTLVLFPQPL